MKATLIMVDLELIRTLKKSDMASWSPVQILKVYLVHPAASFQHRFGEVMNSHLQDRREWGKFTRAAIQWERDENVHCSDKIETCAGLTCAASSHMFALPICEVSRRPWERRSRRWFLVEHHDLCPNLLILHMLLYLAGILERPNAKQFRDLESQAHQSLTAMKCFVLLLLPLPAFGWWCETSDRHGCRGQSRHFVREAAVANPFLVFEDIKTFRGEEPIVVDWDHDGDLDVILKKSDGLSLFEFKSGKHFVEVKPNPFHGIPGGYGQPAVVDWDGDGGLDLIVGAEDEAAKQV